MSRFCDQKNGTFFALLVHDVLWLIDLFERCYKLGPCVTKEERFDIGGPLMGHIVPFKRFYLCVERNHKTLVVRTSDTLRSYNDFVFTDNIRTIEHRSDTAQSFGVFLHNDDRDCFICDEDEIKERTTWIPFHATITTGSESILRGATSNYNVIDRGDFGAVAFYPNLLNLYFRRVFVRSLNYTFGNGVTNVVLDFNGTVIVFDSHYGPKIKICRFGDTRFTTFYRLPGQLYHGIFLDQQGSLVVYSAHKMCKLSTY